MTLKVVLFCGGQGMRLREYAENVPKPLVPLGNRPILWHLMKYYAHYGHKDFVLCLGHGARAIKDYFLHYDECASNDFLLSEGGRKVELLQKDMDDWRIAFVDTGEHSTVGERLRRVKGFVDDEEIFLANYADGLSDLDLDAYLESFRRLGKTACFVSVPVPHSFHLVEADADHHVSKLEAVGSSVVRINGGFFAFRHEIFEHLRKGEDLVLQPFERLIESRQLLAYPFDGFWRSMDTFKDRQHLEDLLARDAAPWLVWRR